MAQAPAKCGTDSGYYRHLRTTKTEPCGPCKAAHSGRWLEIKRNPRGNCPCGTQLRTDHEHCSRCRRKFTRAQAQQETTDDYDPKRPVAWRPNGRGIQVPVYPQSEVA